ncbi:MBL fold metallo-hydrolase [Roseateles violae]|uniref:MBL fold metallo-hydrolase n=1 Tax=Roseateles violae TaxID=3058042 RepID=A0ABT8DS24_9BURK|nr:MBL fold metallo-hydrolase [Pelomonas sp. PFR6]MDN3920778.1 MBL fold metallo-hydrolase [Pelomonas sp. PFR6]
MADPKRRHLLQLLGWLGLGVAAPPRAAQAQQATASAPPLTAELVRTGLYLIASGGGNTLLRFTPQGLLLVDGQAPGLYRPLMSQVRRINKISDLPLRALVLTDHHQPHAGTNPQFIDAHVPLIAQSRTLQRLPPPASDSQQLGYERDYLLKLGGIELQLLHYGPAHTDGDTVVLFPDLRVLAVGDLFDADTPRPDLAAGGDLRGWSRTLEQILRLDFDRVVPGAGPIVGRAELQACKDRLDALQPAAA